MRRERVKIEPIEPTEERSIMEASEKIINFINVIFN